MNDPSSDEKFSVEQYHRNMAKIFKGECVNRSRLGLTRCNIGSSGIMFILMIPAMLSGLSSKSFLRSRLFFTAGFACVKSV